MVLDTAVDVCKISAPTRVAVRSADNRDPNTYKGMVCSFITAAEYQIGFGTVVTHSNQACGQ